MKRQLIVFLDRDGVINKYPGDFRYVISPKEFRFLPKAKQAIANLYRAGYRLFIVSNQAGVSKGIYSKSTLDGITKKMLKGIEKDNGKIEKVLYCLHTDKENCSCRKPKIGLIKQALDGLKNIDLENSFFVGDSQRDVETGRNAGCKTILVLSGKEKIENKLDWQACPDYIAKNLLEASKIILKQMV